MSKNREDQAEELDREAPDDNEPDVKVEQNDKGESVVSGEPGLTRGQRRARERQRERDERAAADKRRDDELSAMRRTIDNLVPALVNRPAPVPVAPETKGNPEWRKRANRQEEIVSLMSSPTVARDVAALEKLREEWHQLDEEKATIAAKSAFEPELAKIRNQQPQESMEYTQLRSEFRDVLGDADARDLAASYFNKAAVLARREKKPFNIMEGHRAAMTQAAQELGIRTAPSPTPSEAQRGRFTGVGPGATKGGGGFSRPLTPQEENVALALAPRGTSQEDANASWVKKTLKVNPGYFKS
jgi:hypothetical protein